jgi:hypothetical protein
MDYNNLLWLPIDIPKFPYPNMELAQDTSWAFWNFTKMVEGDSPYETTVLKQEILDAYPKLLEWFQYFPYKTIRNIKWNTQVGEVRSHIDFTKPVNNPDLFKNNSENEPCGYRILIRGSRTNKLFVMRDDEKVYVDIPEDTDVYVLRHTDGLHGVDADEDRTTIFTHFEIDPIRHRLLIEKSLEKYNNYAVWVK